jgi:hypothetical protein
MAQRLRSFEEEHTFVHGSKLKNAQDWRASVKFGKNRRIVQFTRNRCYIEFEGPGKLGTGYMPTRNCRWRPFEDAPEFVRGLGLRNHKEWQNYAKSSEMPDDISANPKD